MYSNNESARLRDYGRPCQALSSGHAQGLDISGYDARMPMIVWKIERVFFGVEVPQGPPRQWKKI
jgi:hypothetical protein